MRVCISVLYSILIFVRLGLYYVVLLVLPICIFKSSLIISRATPKVKILEDSKSFDNAGQF